MSDDTQPPVPTPTPADDAAATELAALKAQLAETAKATLAGVPEHLRGLIPANMAPADQIAWFNQAKATGVFDKPAVPTTDGGERPAITPKAPDLSSLPTFAKLAAGYSK
ncbi:hypothetical protein [Sphingopyxis terrae]|uniref:hypothetical protein n=1 Tax=Sphingopyxis terrae TaxID=33052 RepID=UPI002A147366|nr:hypothetical protein [Sphingopyxis terrae]MDX8358308.1 hypothetical protein [Sphingopyxis terrae]